MTLATRFPEKGHHTPYQDDLAVQLNRVIRLAQERVDELGPCRAAAEIENAVLAVVGLVVEMEDIGENTRE